VQFAVTVLHNPALIIIDEPFSGLDPVNRLVAKELLTDFSHQGGAVVMSTHQMEQVEEMAERLVMIDKGQRKLYGRVDEVRQEYALHAIVVQGQGDWATLPGVERVEPHGNGFNGMILYLRPEVTSDDVLGTIARSRDMHISRFEMAVPSLNDIFIRVVEGEKHE
jgi:ABC-2 type transport system ATP-binding protein